MFNLLKRIIVLSTLLLSACKPINSTVETDEKIEEAPSTRETSIEDRQNVSEDSESIKVEDETNSEDLTAYDLEPNNEGLFSAPSTPPPGTVTKAIEINNNVPFFSDEDLTLVEPYHQNGALDYLGRVGVANALIGPESMPAEERAPISHIEPTGWNQARYANIGSG